MNENTVLLLEFQEIRDAAASFSLSGEAAEILKSLAPERDLEGTRREKARVSFVLDRINSGDGEPAGMLPDIKQLLSKLGVEGASLEMEEAFALGIFIERGEALKTWLEKGADIDTGGSNAVPAGNSAPVISPHDFLESLPPCSSVAREIFKIIDREGNLRDLPELRDIRRRIKNLNGELEALLARYTGTEETKRMLQSGLPSQRDGRAVLAVKANFRGRIRGIVHEVSGTGQTLFIEPEDVVEKNNSLLLETRRLEAEIRRIFRDLTAKIAVNHAELAEFHEKLLTAETWRARAKYSKELRGNFAKESENVILAGARHPLLGKKAIPVDLKMTVRQVIVTGPNTGGKTVALKTAGLLAMMNQWGLAIPSDEGTALPVFENIFADIGDGQSISQSLSTFSAHMINIAQIAEEATENSLILLDEPGAGTDPQEGSAIAMAILDFLAEKKSRVLVTTHHGALKNYGYTRSGAENASVEFDAETLSPTYRIVMGLPGESRAVEIARRNGLNGEIIARARNYLDGDQTTMSDLIAELKTRRQELEREFLEAKKENANLREEKRRADLRELRLKQKEHEIKSGGMGQLRSLLSESRKTLENLVRELREGEITREKTAKVKEFLNDLAREAENRETALEEEASALREEKNRIEESAARENTGRKHKTPSGENKNPPVLGPGVEVLAGESRRPGVVIRREKSLWLVETGSVRMAFPESDLVPRWPSGKSPGESPGDRPRQKIFVDTAGLDRGEARYEISLRGMRLDEALDALRRQTDAAVMAGLGEFAVVHGTGGGVLQKGVHEYLKTRPEIADYYFSRPEEGGFGRTQVIMKR